MTAAPAPRRRGGPWAALALALGLAAGCGGGGRAVPVVPDALLLPVGVDPRAEADRVAAGLVRAGGVETARRDGEGWSAVAVAAGDRSAVRVVTRLGVRVALDAGPDDTFDRLEVVDPPGGVDDVDGDGRPEVLLAARDRRLDRRCLRLLRVLETGRIAAVPVPDGLAPGEVCLAGFLSPAAAGPPRPFAVAHLPDLARAEVPGVEVPLAFRDGALVAAAPAVARAFWSRAAAAREAALARARAALHVEAQYRLAVELALLDRLRGETGEAAARAFEARFSDVVLTASRRASVDAARRAIAVLPPGPAGVPGDGGPANGGGSDGGGEGQEEEGGADDRDR